MRHPLPRSSWQLAVRCLLALQACCHAGQAAAQDEEPWNSVWPSRISDGFEPFGAEDPAVEGREPRIPEPMVFDLVRPLGARRGEFEINVLGLAPLNRAAGGTAQLPDPLGMVPRSPDRRGFEWAPEAEWAVWDGFAVEFELPFEDSHLEAYKAAAQLTFGTAFNDTFIHGMQVIVQYDIGPGITHPTFLYIAGWRIDEVWSTLLMLGFRSEIEGSREIAERTEKLLNWSLFADVTDYMTLGLETNVATALNGDSTLFVIPQVHWEVTNRIMIQSGVGVRLAKDFTLPEAGFRAIWTY
jgi:hypothetical protein